MSFKKAILLSTLSVAAFGATSALAQNANPNNNLAESAGFYVEGAMGYADRDWKHEAESSLSPYTVGTVTSNKEGGFTMGADAGYQLNKIVAFELGSFYLPKSKGTLTNNGVEDHVDSYSTYVAAKAQLPVYRQTYLFGKLGMAYSHNKWKASGASATSKYWSPMLATGVQYYIKPNVSLTGQYMYIPGYHETTASDYAATSGNHTFDVPAAQLFTVGVGYKFAA